MTKRDYGPQNIQYKNIYIIINRVKNITSYIYLIMVKYKEFVKSIKYLVNSLNLSYNTISYFLNSY